MDLNLFSMKVFLRVAETRSFTRAAEDLFLSQPAVSMQIQKIEQLYQIQLFVRPRSGRIRLTPAGEALKQHAEKLMQLQQEILASMAAHSPALQRELRIGSCCIAGEHLISEGMGAFRQAHPEASLSLSITKCEDVFNGLLDGKFDIGVTGLAPRTRALNKKELIRVRLLLFEAPENQGATSSISIQQLQNRKFILRERGAGCRVELENFFERHGQSLKNVDVVTESESNEAIKKLVKEGYGISALPEFMVRDDIQKGMLSEIVLREGQLTQSFFLVFPRQNVPSILVRALMTALARCSRQAFSKAAEN
jgi:DNA-binding transcriptional LysR family regulator